MTDNAKQQKYFGDWSTWQEMSRDWSFDGAGMATDEEVLIAEYTYEDYSGSAFVLFERDGALFENHGGHCSCYGLEDQWEPEATTWPALAMRKCTVSTPEAQKLFDSLVSAHTPDRPSSLSLPPAE